MSSESRTVVQGLVLYYYCIIVWFRATLYGFVWYGGSPPSPSPSILFLLVKQGSPGRFPTEKCLQNLESRLFLGRKVQAGEKIRYSLENIRILKEGNFINST